MSWLETTLVTLLGWDYKGERDHPSRSGTLSHSEQHSSATLVSLVALNTVFTLDRLKDFKRLSSSVKADTVGPTSAKCSACPLTCLILQMEVEDFSQGANTLLPLLWTPHKGRSLYLQAVGLESTPGGRDLEDCFVWSGRKAVRDQTWKVIKAETVSLFLSFSFQPFVLYWICVFTDLMYTIDLPGGDR